MAQQIVNAQQQVDLAKLPFFHGNPSKDAFTAEHWISRVQSAKNNAGWTDAQACRYMYLALRDTAAETWDIWERNRVDVATWSTVKAEFLRAFGVANTYREALANIRLDQKSGETVIAFANRVSRAVDEFMKMMPEPDDVDAAHIAAEFPAYAAGAAPWAAAATLAQKQAILDHRREEEKYVISGWLARTILLAGLKDHRMREEMVKRREIEPFKDTVDELRNLEVTFGEHKRAPQVTEVEEEGEVEALRKEVEAFRKKYPKKGKSAGKTAKAPSGVICYYCKKPGHFQRDCFTRKRENGAYKDKDGKPWRKGVSETSPTEVYEDNQADHSEIYSTDSIYWSNLN